MYNTQNWIGNSRFSHQLVRTARVVECVLIRTWFPLIPSTKKACAKVSSDGSYNRILTRAVTLVLKDESFPLPSIPSWRARQTAEKLLEWSGDSKNKSAWRFFEDELIFSLIACFHEHRSIRTRREQMWEDYHKLRASTAFKNCGCSRSDWFFLCLLKGYYRFCFGSQ